MNSLRQLTKEVVVSNLISLSLRVFLVGLLLSYFYQPVTNAQNSIDQLRADLNQKLLEIQNKINVYRAQIRQKQTEAKTLKREIDILETQIKQIELELEQTDLAIQKLTLNIERKQKEISRFDTQIEIEKKKLAECLQMIYEYDQISLSEIILQNDNFSDILNEIQSLENIQKEINERLNNLHSLKAGIEEQKKELEEEKAQYNQLKMLQDIQKKSYQTQQEKKQDLLNKTKGQEVLFNKLMIQANSDIASIKNQLYLLEGVGLSMTLEEALRHAEYASSKTGVRPAFLLAVLKKESSWGTNVGTGFWRSDMHPRDHQAFLDICQKLGFNPDSMPISRKPSYGWGGAMGPAQFLPSTWLQYESEIARLTGHNPPNPWNIDDSFVAAALKLAKNGANIGTYDAEWKAAMIYFAGSNWTNPLYRFYGDSVMDLARIIQEEVDEIKRNN